MQTSKTNTAIPIGFDGQLISVEGDANRGLPTFNIVGMASRSISESKDRIRSALTNSGFSFPKEKIIINLAPAELEKSGSSLDLAIAMTILALSKQLLQADIDDKMFIGELSLNGAIKPVKGIINMLECAKKHGVQTVYIPKANSLQAQLIAKNLKVIPIENLRELWLHLKQKHRISPLKGIVKNTQTDKNPTYSLDHIAGLDYAKRALTIAIAGRHNLLLSGPPGTGKSMLARTAHSLLPTPSIDELLAITKLHNLVDFDSKFLTKRPLRSPHHSSSRTAVLGGGPKLSPGEISLAHQGILFLDELLEFPRDVLESLRQPLEDRSITLSRANLKTTYPCNFILIATANPCPCGYLGSATHECTCSPSRLSSYRKKLSGPLLDRFDMTLNIQNIDNHALLDAKIDSKNTHKTAMDIIKNATKKQQQRYRLSSKSNSSLSINEIKQYIILSHDAKTLLNHAADKLKISARAYFKIIKLAQTISDLETTSTQKIQKHHIAEALQYRQQV